jgi:hypothetical protein
MCCWHVYETTELVSIKFGSFSANLFFVRGVKNNCTLISNRSSHKCLVTCRPLKYSLQH